MQAKIILAVAVLGFATLTQTAQAQTAAPSSDRGLTRAEVQADLALWRRAGLDMAGEADGFDPTNPDYQRRLATYQRWRGGPEYMAELKQLQGRQVAASTTAASTRN